MRKQFILVLIFLFFYQLSYTQWQWSNPQPSGYINNKITFTSSSDGFIFNNNGDLINTTDGGNSWKIQQNFPNTSMMELLDSTGIIAGYNGTIFISPDNGSTWNNVLFPYTGSINQVDIVSRDSIFMLRTSSITGATELCQSTNRGTTWKITNSRLYIRSFQFLNSKIGYAASNDGIYKSTDGGSSWQNAYLYPTTERFAFFEFLDENVGYAYKGSTGILKTTDGGKTWTVSATNSHSGLSCFFLVSNRVAYAAGAYGMIFKTTDSGTSWQKLVQGAGVSAHDIYSLYFSARDSGFAVGHRGCILKTTNGGSSWQEYAPIYNDMKALHFVTDAVGYAATYRNLIKTTDAGKSWSRLGLTMPDPDDFFRYIHFFNKDTGLAIADAPVQLYKTYNGGKNWRTVQLPNVSYNSFLGAFFTGNTGYLSTSASPNRVYKTSDAGETWTIQSSDHYKFYTYLQFTDEKTGYGVNGPFIYKTQDSGRSWYQLLFEPGTTINALCFVNPLTGYAAGNNGYLKRTSDSGHT